MNLNVILLSFCFACTWCACTPDESENQQIDIHEDLVLDMLPTLNYSTQGLRFSFRSNEIYNCDDVGFTYTINSSPADVGIHLLNVQVPAICTGGNSHAIENIKVPADEGTYSIAIDIGQNIHNTGILVNEGSSYRINMNTRFGMAMPHDIMYKIPEGTIWGYVYNSSHPGQTVILQQVKDLLDPITDQANLPEGYYGYFKMNSIGGVSILYPEEDQLKYYFVFHLNSTTSTLETVVQQIKDQLPQGSEFKLYSWQGTEF